MPSIIEPPEKPSNSWLIANAVVAILLCIGIALLFFVFPPAEYHILPGPTLATLPTILLPEFPWPPPTPSATASLTFGSLTGTSVAGPTLGDVDGKISQALTSAGYDEISYYGIPNGFVTVTRLEQIYPTGYPMYSDRWITEVTPISLATFSLDRYMQALFGVPKGHYRIFVFFITSDVVAPSGTAVSKLEAQAWALRGASKLPIQLKSLPFTRNYICTVYIYEFVQLGVGGPASQELPSDITGRQHLERAGLWDILEK